MIKKTLKVLALMTVFVVLLSVTNAYLFVPKLKHSGELVAYRGGGSLVDYEKLNETGFTAKSLLESGVDTVENTLESVTASVSSGAEVIHLNVHRTADDQLVVFHDWTLDYATDASGAIAEVLYEDLEHVDAGYGYTFDDGATYPFRAKGFKISKLSDFYTEFPQHKFWLNLKDNDDHSFQLLYNYILSLSSDSYQNTMVITSSKGISWFQQAEQPIRTISVNSVKTCGIDYLLIGWAGIIPESCKNTALFVPPSMTKYFWGYPNRLAARLQYHGSDIYLWSKHKPIGLDHINVVSKGIGVITSDLNFIAKAKAKKHSN